MTELNKTPFEIVVMVHTLCVENGQGPEQAMAFAMKILSSHLEDDGMKFPAWLQDSIDQYPLTGLRGLSESTKKILKEWRVN